MLILVVMLAAWLSGEGLAGLGWIRSPLGHALAGIRHASFYFVMMFAGMTLLHLAARPPRREWLAIAVLAPGLTALLVLFGPWLQLGLSPSDGACVGSGLASLLILGVRVARGREARATCLFLLICMLPLFTVLNPFFQDLTNRFTPLTLDHVACAADEALGLQWSFWMGQWFELLPPLRITAAVIYYTLLFAFLAVLVVQQRAQRPPYLDIFPTLLATTLLGYAVYLIFPVVGPEAAFGEAFPWLPPDSLSLTAPLAVPAAPRNCMPSLHTVWVLLIWWHCRPCAWPVRVGAGVYLALTLLATLGFGFHYLVDLIVAVPFALVVQAVATPHTPATARQRKRGLLFGAALVAAWLLLIRFGVPLLAWSPLLAWAATAATVAVAWRQERRLYAAQVG